MNLIIEICFFLSLLLMLLAYIYASYLANKLKELTRDDALSGFEIAQKYAQNSPHIIKKSGKFLDFYHKERNVIKLSSDVFDGTNMYATLIALNVAFETKNESSLFLKFPAFSIALSYIIICLGAFLTNYSFIHLGLLLFTLTFILRLLSFNHKPEIDEEVLTFLGLSKPEIKPYLNIYSLILIARLPYEFLNYLR